MILGKRHRPPIKRTTSMTEFSPTATTSKDDIGCIKNNNINPLPNINNKDATLDHRFLAATISPRNHRRNSADHIIQASHFLTVCGLCNRRLIPGKDIFMYRGDSAFCSSECRQEQMNQDEKKDKHSLVPKKPLVSVHFESSSNPSKVG